MPDLETAAVKTWLRERQAKAPGVLDVAARTAGETAKVLSALQRCGSTLDKLLVAGDGALSRLLRNEPARGEPRQVTVRPGIGRVVRSSGWIARKGMPDAEAVVAGLSTADPAGCGRVPHVSLAEAVRPVLLSRLFAPERLGDPPAACTQVSRSQEVA